MKLRAIPREMTLESNKFGFRVRIDGNFGRFGDGNKALVDEEGRRS